MKKNVFMVLVFGFICIMSIGCVKERSQLCREYIAAMGFTGKATAVDYNTYGLRYYEQKDYKKAEDLFRCSIKKNNSYQVFHYNLACMLSIQYGQGKQEYKQEIFKHLKIAIQLDPIYVQKIQTDKDFDPVRNLAEFQELSKTGEDTKNTDKQKIQKT